MKECFRIHGDNIVECERISDLIIRFVKPTSVNRYFSSLSCIVVEIIFNYQGKEYEWDLEIFPGFNKSTNDRWKTNIFELLKEQGSFLDETPDVVLTKVNGFDDEILVAIEFCSALQAGNQAWQRSGRAYSTGRTECPYIYIVDFIKYELDSETRERKALRYPNAAVPYSYVSHAINHKNFVSQAYFKAEEFQPGFDNNVLGFDESIFSENEVALYLLQRMCGMKTDKIEKEMLDKNMKMVMFLSSKAKDSSSLTDKEWSEIYDNGLDIIDYSVKKNRFKFKKKIAEKSITGFVRKFNLIVQKYSIGLASVDLPFGIIPEKSRSAFAREVIKLYSIDDEKVQNRLINGRDLVICMLKGFKPRGDDNRPDRGALPLIGMLAGENTEILTFVYGPLVEGNLRVVDSDIMKLALKNGLWKSFIGLSDIIIIDAPVIGNNKQAIRIIDNRENKKKILERQSARNTIKISNIPNQYQENDVDTVIHFLFKYIMKNKCFEGMCNPPGGDWSGLSITKNNTEYRWLSLPRVSVDGKRPDHLVEIFDLFEKPTLLVIESKEKANDLEKDVGIQLKHYLEHLFNFKPSVEKSDEINWKISDTKIDFKNFECVSVAAYIKVNDTNKDEIYKNSQCDVLFELHPKQDKNEWIIDMYASTSKGEETIKYIKNEIKINTKFLTIKTEDI